MRQADHRPTLVGSIRPIRRSASVCAPMVLTLSLKCFASAPRMTGAFRQM
jgi:hypothetical protein